MSQKYVLSAQAANKLRVLLGQGPDTPFDKRRGRDGARPSVIVKCLDDTAVGGNDAGDQCYEACVLELNAYETMRDELSRVWLTLLTDSGDPSTPTVDAVYHGILSGWFDPDPGGAGTDQLRRVFAVAPAAAGAATVSQWKEPVRVATTTNGTLASAYENGDTVDGVTLATGDRILLKNQTTGAENGIYTVNASGAPTRATDCDAASEFPAAVVAVSEGTVNADTVWICRTNALVIVGTTATVWARLAPTLFQIHGGSAYAITADSTWEDTGVTLTLSESGTFEVIATAGAAGTISGTVTDTPKLRARVVVGGSSVVCGAFSIVTLSSTHKTDIQGTGAMANFYQTTFAAGDVLKLQAWRDPISGGGTWGTVTMAQMTLTAKRLGP